jgi:hypothetical protein
MDKKPEQPVFTVENMTQEGKNLFGVLNALDHLLGKVTGLDANEAMMFAEVKQWLQMQGKMLFASEQRKATFKAAPPPPALVVPPKLEVVPDEKKE